MSERGSFVTEYIHCEACHEAAKKVLLARGKYLCSTTIQTWAPDGVPLPIIAGKIGGSYPGEEIVRFEQELNEDLATTICHPLRIAVIAEHGERVFTVAPT